MRNTIKLKLFLGSLLLLCSCTTASQKGKHYLHPKFKPLNKLLQYSIKEQGVKFEYILKQLKDTAKSDLSIQKIATLEAVKNYSLSIDDDLEKIIIKVQKNATDDNIEKLMLANNRASYSNRLIRAFNKTFTIYQKDNLKYSSNPKSWSKRYLDLIPPKQKSHPPSFGEFYFKNSNKLEVLITLKTLQLSAIQEALEIQQKIIYEK